MASHDPLTPSQPPRQAAPVAIARPKHPLHALTTFELRDFRRDLEQAIALSDRQEPVSPGRDRLQATLDEVLAEQDERARLARA